MSSTFTSDFTWINDFIDEKGEQLLSNLYIPGSASACAYTIIENDINGAPIIEDIYKARVLKQKYPIDEQFRMGARVFEIQIHKEVSKEIGEHTATYYIVTNDYDDAVIKHMKLHVFVNIINNLLINNPNESIIILNNRSEFEKDYESVFNYLVDLFNVANSGKNKYSIISNIDSSTKLKKNTLYIKNEFILNLINVEKIHDKKIDLENLIKNNTLRTFYKYTTYGKVYYIQIYCSMFFVSYIISTISMFLFLEAYSLFTNTSSQKNKNYQIFNTIIFYLCSFIFYFYMFLFIYLWLLQSDYIISGKYNDDIIKQIRTLISHDETIFPRVFVLYDNCDKDCNRDIYMKNFYHNFYI